MAGVFSTLVFEIDYVTELEVHPLGEVDWSENPQHLPVSAAYGLWLYAAALSTWVWDQN